MRPVFVTALACAVAFAMLGDARAQTCAVRCGAHCVRTGGSPQVPFCHCASGYHWQLASCNINVVGDCACVAASTDSILARWWARVLISAGVFGCMFCFYFCKALIQGEGDEGASSPIEQ